MIKDKSGVPMTCPTIDEIIDLIHSDEYDKENVIEMIEEVRAANIKLREFGNEQFKINNDGNN